MVKIFKNHLSLCACTAAFLFFAYDAHSNVNVQADAASAGVKASAVNGAGQSDKETPCVQKESSYYCASGDQEYKINGRTYQFNSGSAERAAIEVSGQANFFGENITVKGVVDEKKFWKYGVKVSEKARVTLIDYTLSGVLVGLESQGSTVGISGGSIDAISDAIKVGEFAERQSQDAAEKQPASSVYLMDTRINLGDVGIKAGKNGRAVLKGVSISGKGGQELNADRQSDHAAFHILFNGSVEFEKDTVDVTDAHGVLIQRIKGLPIGKHSKANITVGGNALIKDSNITVRGNAVYGMYFDSEEQLEGWLGVVTLKDTRFIVPDSIAIYGSGPARSVVELKSTKLFGDLLLKANRNSSIRIFADASELVGQTQVDNGSLVELILENNSRWVLLRPRHKNSQGFNYTGVSSISLLHLFDSSIVFQQPEANIVDGYQTLRVGRGRDYIYAARGNAHIYLNTYLNSGGALGNQRTDRVLIYGDVEGKTTVHVQSVAGSLGGYTGSGGNEQGISIIQVSGEAEEDSFKLDGDYVALDGLPYQYRLRAYGPSSDLGKANASQRLVEGEGDFWDFRLENGPAPNPRLLEPRVKAVVPQVPSYLILPNSLFHAGLRDISNQNKQLEIQRANSSGVLETREKPASFLRGYGGSYHYASDLSALEYGYGGDLGYYALEGGLLLKAVENVESVVSFGVMGSYGKLSLQPLDVAQSQKSTFDKWTATVYGSMKHDAGFYVDGLLSYGLFKGDVLTTARGKTATLKGHPLSVSLMGGQKITTGYEGVVFDPQAQVVYQHLQFDDARDIDNFAIEMGKFDQWVVRLGGLLMKTLATPEKDRDVSFYGKLHFAHDFSKERSVRFKDSFKLGSFGSSLEAGLGLNARLSQNLALHGDFVYQHKLSKGGFSGISFSGGLRYRF
ncbi:autotransporter outer membrane beta-barrel domain-containing protein [Bartonella florencae]|uniref:autotransporter family protein n=1 Tax=Bartonella florencae TaxID=928210 RepID=UPI0002E586C4|nr:autotransporter outer membrane beta-barrel domain-containing protein [Bartonella florencae]